MNSTVAPGAIGIGRSYPTGCNCSIARFASATVKSGMALHTEEAAICDSYGFETLYKPFLSQDLKSVLHALLLHGASERAKVAGS